MTISSIKDTIMGMLYATIIWIAFVVVDTMDDIQTKRFDNE